MANLPKVLLATLGLALVASSPAAAVPLEGEWRGSGSVEIADGGRESVTCRITYSRHSDTVHGFNAICANASMRVIQTGVVSKATATTYVGTTHNPEWNISGRIRIAVSGSSQTVTVRAEKGSARIALRKK